MGSLLLLLAAAGAVGQAPALEIPSEAAAAEAGLSAGLAVHPTWEPQAAPGSVLAPAADARPEAILLAGWRKIIVRPPTAGAARAAPQPLPDEWGRHGSAYSRAWYVLRADLTPGDLPLWLRFDAVTEQCELFVNGRHVGGHLGGYTPFEFEITPFVRPGENILALFVRDQSAVISRTAQTAVAQVGVARPSGPIALGGIRGGVYLERRPATYLQHLLIHTSTRHNEIRVRTWLGAPAPVDAVVSAAVYDWPGLGNSPVLVLPDARIAAGRASVESALPWATARRWSPEHPNLYVLRTTLRAGGKSETVDTRFGFREFWADGKSFMLNGSPIRLMGASVARDFNSALTPGVATRASRDAFGFLKREFNYRAMRLHASIHPPAAAEAADEEGFLLINQSGLWSAMGGYYTNAGDELLRNSQREFTEWFWRDANSPSVVIWDVENELIRDQRGPEREHWVLALDRFIKDLDPTRIVEHAGAAWYSPTQEDIHVHMQEQYHAVLRDWAATGRVPLIMGEFWVGGRGGETRLTDSREFTDLFDYHQDESRLYREQILEMRSFGASGVMPFWLDRDILGRTSEGLRRTYDPRTDRLYRWNYPGLRNLGAEALAPAIAFAWPRSTSVVGGRPFEREVVVCNDREEAATFAVACDFAGQHRQWSITLRPAAQDRRTLSFDGTAEGAHDLIVTLAEPAGKRLGEDRVAIHTIALERETAPRLSRRLVVAPAPSAETAAALRDMGLIFTTASAVPVDAGHTLLLVPPGAAPAALGRDAGAVRAFLASGGRLLVLNQTQAPEWMPLTLPFWPSAKKSAPEFTLLGWPAATRDLIFSREIPLYAAGHPVFAGLTAGDFAEWSADDGRVSDDAFVRPAAVGAGAGAPYRVLAGATRRENASVVEASIEGGTAIFCQAQVLASGAAPAARVFLLNLLGYLDGPAWRVAHGQVALAGNLSAAKVERLTGLPAAEMIGATDSLALAAVVLAGDGADPALLNRLARGGTTVLVLSRQTAARIPGYAVRDSGGANLAGTRGGATGDPLFWGVSTASFLPLEQSAARAVLAHFPPAATVSLGGVSGPGRWERFDGDDPVAVSERRGAGRLVVTTLEPWNPGSESHRQLLCTLLANAGLELPAERLQTAVVAVKSTPPIRIDGRLDEWTNDMEDRNVSAFTHAEPIVLSRRTRTDLDLSGILYVLHDSGHLYLAGIVFSAAPPRLTATLNGRTLTFDLATGAATPHFALGRVTARDAIDTRLLTLSRLNAQVGAMEPAPDAFGRTFEAAIGWSELGLTSEPAEMSAAFGLACEGGGRLDRSVKLRFVP